MKNRSDLIAATAQAHVDSGAFASIEWNVHRDGAEWQRGAVGMADPLNGVELPEDPIYRIYSMTKPVVSAIAMMLIEEGRLHLATPVSAYVKGFGGVEVLEKGQPPRRARTAMTVAHLMTHTSGISYGFLPDCPVAKLYREAGVRRSGKTLAEMVEAISTFPVAFEPGTQWRYSEATDVLARIIEIIEDKPLNQVMRERVTSPLGLADTGYMVREEARHCLMPMFGNANIDQLMRVAPGPQQLTPADVSDGYPADDPNFGRGGYGLFSTAREYMVVAKFLGSGLTPSGEPLLSRKAVELMWRNRVPDAMRPLAIGLIQLPGYGFSLAGRVMVEPGVANVFSSPGECGWSGAASTYLIIDPKEKLHAVFMAQYLGSKIRLAEVMQNAVYQAL